MRGRSRLTVSTSGAEATAVATRPSDSISLRARSPADSTISEPAGNSTSPTLNDAFAPFIGTSFRRWRSVIRFSAPLCLTIVTAPVPLIAPAVTTSAVSSAAGASRMLLSSMVLMSMLFAIPIDQALSS